MKSLLERLNNVGFERTRRAVAALSLSLFVFLFLVFALLMWMNGQTAWVPSFIALAIAYAVAFMGVAAEWFWGRWFGAGLAWSGVITSVGVLFQLGEWNPVLGGYGILHGLVVLMLSGSKMAERYDLQPAWRERYGMDEFGVARLRKTVTRASASLPSVILYALAPKEPGQAIFTAATLVAGVLAVAGLASLVRVRTWGLVALAGAAMALFVGGAAAYPHFNFAWANSGFLFPAWGYAWAYGNVVAGPAVPVLLLGAALAPFAGPTIRFLRARG
ncbi:MAG TPA: hypothetical protein VHL80_21000 [Polyangia bacterium]|nr:hypothetical protein [Polyangia bacterium]